MFLATTALDQFWDKKEKILFLGSWCLRGDRPEAWRSLDYEVMPSPWANRARYNETAESVGKLVDELLAFLSDWLDRVHRTRHGVKYWRILLGPWLDFFLQPTLDRYAHLKAALEREPGLRTYVLDPSEFAIPLDRADFLRGFYGDRFNLQLFSLMLQSMGRRDPPLSARLERDDWPPPAPEGAHASPEIALLSVAETASAPLRRRARVLIGDVYPAPKAFAWRMAWRTRGAAAPLVLRRQWSFARARPAMSPLRASLATTPPWPGEFGRVVADLLPWALPALYLEDYPRARQEAARRLSAHPAAIVSSIGWHSNEPFQFAAAECSLRGTRMVTVQHGGGYGIYRHSPVERFERLVGDEFWAWGWGEGERLRNMCNPRLSELANRFRRRPPRRGDDILLLPTVHIRWLWRFHSCPTGSDWERYFDWLMRFLASASPRLGNRLVVRGPNQPELAQAHRERILQRFPAIRFDDGRPIDRWLRECGLVVADHLGTSLLECMAADVPFIAFWDPRLWELRSEAEAAFASLRGAGILHDSPEAAAEKVAQVAPDPSSWWSDARVQAVRVAFADRYALARPDYFDGWTRGLMGLAGKASEQGNGAPGTPA